MNEEEFVGAIHQAVYEPVVDGTLSDLRQPAVPSPGERDRALQGWYLGLDETGQRMVREVVRNAAHAAVFDFLCVLDGIRVIDDPPHVGLQLTVVYPDGTKADLGGSSSVEEMHDIFNGLVHPYSEDRSPRADVDDIP
jgi:hypothetical protein